jgi:starch phosphorylase
MSIIEEGLDKKVRMAYLSIVCSHTVNGVLKQTIFKEFDAFYPGKIQNKTNGVTPRRWLHCCNPGLSDLIGEVVGGVDEWVTSLENLESIKFQAENNEFVQKFAAVKRKNKERLRDWVL